VQNTNTRRRRRRVFVFCTSHKNYADGTEHLLQSCLCVNERYNAASPMTRYTKLSSHDTGPKIRFNTFQLLPKYCPIAVRPKSNPPIITRTNDTPCHDFICVYISERIINLYTLWHFFRLILNYLCKTLFVIMVCLKRFFHLQYLQHALKISRTLLRALP